jgi:NosR/NirI family transcriptional regulator, nitrous oxide reductase regulator
VSGASVTAGAVTTTVREMLRRHQAVGPRKTIPWGTLTATAWIAAGLLVGLTRSGRRVRLGYAVVSVAAGLTLGWMVGQDQLIGWARNGVDFSYGMPLLLLTAVALLVPAFTGKNIYCSRICPHGAAQTLAGTAIRRRFAMPPRLHRVFQRVPWLTLLAIWTLALLGSGLPFAMIEPFEVWSAGFHAILPAAILSIGLLAAVFLPQAYCHYGCPTGALLKFLTHSPGDFTRRDAIAAALVAAGWIYQLMP